MSVMLAVDFGSHLCKVAIADAIKKGPDELEISLADPPIPAILSLGEDQHIKFDIDAKALTDSKTHTTINSFKRLLGIASSEAEYLANEKTFIHVPIRVDERGVLGLEVIGRVFSPIQLTSIFLRRLVEIFSSISQASVSRIVITVPNWFSSVQRQSLIDACRMADLPTVGIIHDTTASAIYYSLSHRQVLSGLAVHNAIIIDIGHSDSSVTVLQLCDHKALVKSVASDLNFGGRSIDHAILLHLGAIAVDNSQTTNIENQMSSGYMLNGCQKIKEALSSGDVTQAIPFDAPLNVTITGETFNGLVSSLGNILGLIKEALNMAGVIPAEIHAIELLGGTTVLSPIRKTITSLFPPGTMVSSGPNTANVMGSIHACTLLGLSGYFEFNDHALSNMVSGEHHGVDIWKSIPQQASHKLGPKIAVQGFDHTKDSGFTLLKCQPQSEIIPSGKTQASGSAEGKASNLDDDIINQKSIVDAMPDSHPEKHMHLTTLATLITSRFDKNKNPADLKKATLLQVKAIGLSKDQADKAKYFNLVAIMLRKKFDLVGDLSNLEKAIQSFQIADVNAIAVGDTKGRIKYLSNLSGTYLLCYQKKKNMEDLDKAIDIRRSAVDLMSDDADKGKQLNFLGLLLESRFDKTGNVRDLREAVTGQEKAIQLPHDEDSLGELSFNLGVLLLKLFDLEGNIADLDASIRHQKNAVGVTPENNPQKAMYLNHLGDSLQSCFLKKWNLDDLDKAIEHIQHAVDLIPNTHQSKVVYLNNLGKSLGLHFTHQKNPAYLDRAISAQQMALDLTPEQHINKAMFLRNLAMLLESRFNFAPEISRIQDLELAIVVRQKAADLTVDFHPAKPKHLFDLAADLYTCYTLTNDLLNLNQAISAHKNALDLLLNTGSEEPEPLYDLAALLQKRFDKEGNLNDVEEAILALQKALSRALDNETKAKYMQHLGAALHCRFIELHNPTDLESALANAKEALGLISYDSPQRLPYLNSLAIYLISQFHYFGNGHSVEAAVKYYEEIISLTPDGHPKQASRLNNLGVALQDLFKIQNDTGILDKAICIMKEAVSLTPEEHEAYPEYISNLGNSLQTHYRQPHIGGNIEELDTAIKLQQQAVILAHGHPNQAGYYTNLGNSLQVRYEELGELYDLNAAIGNQRVAVKLTPLEHAYKSSVINNLGNSLHKLYKSMGRLEDLKEAKTMYQEAVTITPNSHNYKPMFLCNLGYILAECFDKTQDIEDLNQSISCHQAAFDISPNESLIKYEILTGLGDSLIKHFWYTKQFSDLEEAITCLETALSLTDNHIEQTWTFILLGKALEAKFSVNGDMDILEQALLYYSQAATRKVSTPHPKYLIAALAWIDCALKYSDPSVIDAYSIALDILPQLTWLGLSMPAQLSRIFKARTLPSDAAATAIGSGNPDLALEWLEKGRSIIWGQILQLRSPLESLAEIAPILATTIKEVSVALDNQIGLGSNMYSPSHRGYQRQLALLFQEQIAEQHRLAKKWDDLIKEAQDNPEFKDIFRGKSLSELKQTAGLGPIVVLNVSKLRCDAIIIVSPSLPLLHCPLDQTSYYEIENLQKMLTQLLTSNLSLPQRASRHGGPARKDTSDNVFRHVLKELWIKVVKPVISMLKFTVQPDTNKLPHIWWCPTSQLTLLPLHAAGIYATSPGGSIITLADYALSSYTPNLSVLLKSMEQRDTETALKVLAVIQPNTPGQSRLSGTLKELEIVQKYMAQYPLSILLGPDATTETVSNGLSRCSWAHLSCHGLQNTDDPTQSGLVVQDGMLGLLDIIKNPSAKAEFAFLSACQTATGDYMQPDEAIHLAGGMMTAGFNSVVATMWSVGDHDAPLVAETLYAHLFRDGKPNLAESAHALHIAVLNLRSKYNNSSFASWVPFIHMGL